MGGVIYDKSTSLDGFIAGANVRLEAGLGDDGERLHDWDFQDEAGAIDEISVHLVPVLFGSGTPLFGEGVDEHVTLEFVGVSESPHAAHLRYRVVRDG